MSRMFDFFPNVRSRGQLCTRTLFESAVRSTALPPLLAQIAATDDADERGRLKKLLPIVTWQAHFERGRRMSSRAVPSGLFMVDIDHVDNPDALYHEKVEPMIERLGIVAVHKTPSAHGLRIVAQCYDWCTSLQTCQEHVAHLLDVDIDTVCKDYARSSFLVSEDYFYHIDKAALWEGEPVRYTAPDLPVREAREVRKEEERRDILSPSIPKTPVVETKPESTTAYLGIPYDEIIRTWWRVHYDGREPVKSNRNTLTFELACALRHITGFDADLLDSIIPSYDGFPEDEKRQCIESALKQKVTRMPARLMTVLQNIRLQHADNAELVEAVDEAEEMDEAYYAGLLPLDKLPRGVKDTLDGLPPAMYMPALVGIGPMIGALATDVQLRVNGEMKCLNLIAYIVGEAASGKSFMDQLYDLWMYDLIAQDTIAHAVENEYLEQMRRKKNARELPQNPHVLIRLQSLKTSNAQLLTRLQQSQGKHLYSYTPEAGQICENQGQSWSNLSVLIRSAFDNSKYDTDYKNVDSTGVVIPSVRWNISMCCTPDVLHKANKNVTDGTVTRLAIARTPDNTFSRLIESTERSGKACRNIRDIAHLLTLMHGELELPLLQMASGEWLEEIRLECMKDMDRVRARLRMRTAVIAMRYVCCYMLCAYAQHLLESLDENEGEKPGWAHGCQKAEEYLKAYPDALKVDILPFQSPELIGMLNPIADYLLDMQCFYFRDDMERAYEASNYQMTTRARKGKNEILFDKLPNVFTVADLCKAKGRTLNPSTVRVMLKRWRDQELIERKSDNTYCKKT